MSIDHLNPILTIRNEDSNLLYKIIFNIPYIYIILYRYRRVIKRYLIAPKR